MILCWLDDYIESVNPEGDFTMRHRRAFVLVCTALALLASMFALPDAAANQAAALSAGAASVETGASTTVPITWDPGSVEARALTIEITYDPSIITVNACTLGPIVAGSCGFTSPGVIRLAGFDFGMTIAAGTLGEITFTGTSAGESALDVSIETITDMDGQSLAGNTLITDGSVTVEEPEPEPEPEPDRRRKWRRLIRRMWMRWLRACYFGHWNGW